MVKESVNFSSISLVACIGLLACKPTGTSSCLSTSSKTLVLSEQSDFVQGGYLHFGEKSCSAMFDILEVNPDSIRLRGFSARHCRFENGVSIDKVSVSLYFDRTNSKNSGYIKNIPVDESFVLRANNALADTTKLNSPEMNIKILDALRIPTQYDPWSDSVFSDNKETVKYDNEADNSSIICNNFSQITRINDPQNKLTQSCWSFLDLGTFDLVIKKSSLSGKDYSFLSTQLNSKRQALNAYLEKNSSLKKSYFEQRKHIENIISLLRLQKAAQLAYLLNLDLCKIPTEAESLCKHQAKLIEILGNNFIEVDENGVVRNIFDRLADGKTSPNASFVKGLTFEQLRSGQRMSLNLAPKTLEDAEQIASAFAQEIQSLLKDKTAIAVIRLREMIAEHSRAVDTKTMSPALIVSANFFVKRDQIANAMQFSLFNAHQMVTDTKKIVLAPDDLTPGKNNVHGVSSYGTLRIAYPKNAQVVKFHPTDSGSLLTLSGVVPLMALNTVDDVGTSGGTAILALPEINEDDSISAITITKRNALQNKAAAGAHLPSQKGQVEINTESFSGSLVASCN